MEILVCGAVQLNMKEDVVCWKFLTCSDVMEINGGKCLFKTRYKWKGKVSVAIPMFEVI